MQQTVLVSLPGFAIISTTSDAGLLTVTALSLASTAACPTCGTHSRRIHSTYTRTPRDLPVSTSAVRLVLHVRRFRYLHAACSRQTFAERLPEVVPVAAQRTFHLTQMLTRVAVALGGEAGARLSGQLSVPIYTHIYPPIDSPQLTRPTTGKLLYEMKGATEQLDL